MVQHCKHIAGIQRRLPSPESRGYFVWLPGYALRLARNAEIESLLPQLTLQMQLPGQQYKLIVIAVKERMIKYGSAQNLQKDKIETVF